MADYLYGPTPGEWQAIPADRALLNEQVPLAELDNWRIVGDSPEYPGPMEELHNATLMSAAPTMLAALTDKLPCTVSNKTFADDLETIARTVDLAGFNITAADLLEKAKQIRAVVALATMRAVPE
jgi:hypothetical protein